MFEKKAVSLRPKFVNIEFRTFKPNNDNEEQRPFTHHKDPIR